MLVIKEDSLQINEQIGGARQTIVIIIVACSTNPTRVCMKNEDIINYNFVFMSKVLISSTS